MPNITEFRQTVLKLCKGKILWHVDCFTPNMKKVLSLGIVLTGIFYASDAKAQAAPDTMLMVVLPRLDVTASHKWDNDTARYRYNQTKYYITTILPYLNAATKLFKELDAKVSDPAVGKKERRAFVNTKEDELRDKFEKEVKKLNETQGVLLVKLIGRQTAVNIYGMLQEFKNPLTAVKWQTWARLNGFNLNKRYNPDDEPMLENIMEGLGYPLPDQYGRDTEATLQL
jgi:hypothetical protein